MNDIIKTLDRINDDMVVGKDYINISTRADTKVGRELTYTAFFTPVDSLVGKINSIRTAVDYLSIAGYPYNLLRKRTLTFKDVNTIPKERVELPNLKSILIHLIWVRIKNNVELLKHIDENMIITSFRSTSHKQGNVESIVKTYNDKTYDYIDALKQVISLMLKGLSEDEESEEVIKLMIKNKKRKDLKIFENSVVQVSLNI